MIKSFTATTREIDDAQAAVSEILAGLDCEKKLLKNSLGIISCFSEFDETGVLKAVCGALPFDTIGATTCLCSSAKEIDQIILAVTVLTSDDCDFKTVMFPVAENFEQSIESSLKEYFNQFEEKPAMFLSYFPLINTLSGDMIIAEIDKATGGVPLFGTTAVDHKMDYSTSKTIYNGEGFREAVVLGAVYGAPKLSFEIASLNEDRIRKQKAIITESSGSILIGVNGKTAMEYFEEIGLTRAELSTGLGILPLIINHKDGTRPVARAVFTVTPEGHAVCGGAMPVNATLNLGRIDREDVLNTTGDAIKSMVEKEKDSVIISYSCMARFLSLGTDNNTEARIVRDAAGDTQYLFANSGGEICPLPDANGTLKNYYHNYTIVFCKLG